MEKQRQQSPFAKQYQNQPQTKTAPQPPAAKSAFSFSFSDGDKLDEQLRKPRSRAYMEIFDAVDLISATDEEIIQKLQENMDPDTAEEFSEMSTEELLEEIRASIQEEFRTMSIDIKSVLHGVLAKCYIDGCDCHAIGPTGMFLEHYSEGGPIPQELAKGRGLFQRYPDCRCIEVYTDCCRVVMGDSKVIRVGNSEI